jgi:class 3 adenylate cyclase
MREAARSLAASEQQLRDEAAVRADLGRYLPAQLVDKIVRREQSLALGGELRRVTVLFADVAGFSTLVGERPPPVVVAILNQLFTILSELVFRHGGTVDKFIGDCVMAFWNAPDAQADHGARAVAAAADMARWVEAANEIWQDQHGVTVHLAIGIHTGDAVIGNFGSERRMEYTCIGEAVSLAARLEAIARPSQILVTEAVRDAAGDRFTYLPLGQHRVARRLEPVELFEVIP